MELKDTDKAYTPTANVAETWKRFGWIPPSDNPEVVSKWLYYKSLATLSHNQLNG